MMDAYANYLDLLRQLTAALRQLTDLSREKMDAVRKDDLKALDLVLKQEQAISLSMRSLERKRQKALDQLQLGNIPLSRLAARYPQETRLEAKTTVEDLQREYKIYKNVSAAARDVLEGNLHEIENTLGKLGAENVGVPGYAVEPPSQLKTDIRA
jgi:hypothetical protein